jgi:hypothetical protein
VFQNRVLGRMFVAKRDDVTVSRRKVNDKDLHKLNTEGNIET